ncbi:radical SAM/SPASM protein FxsBH, inactivated beta-hydroxylase extension form [Streptomyces sp. WI04-05B]|uniref:radical SAM/SPASM protein FxsBH, inactivated beta-hydroxylase extension form n=1 Tax=Streptomyces TaxID=1883 RepID=UPI0029B4FFD1|nr:MULTISPECIES: radical SAM/SPASM protein FxsB, inactivated metallohydrolase extension form [unclassified Streptomyces]MDX2540466.1 radical SAM/SPASM protein FxsB, inactivated metallohydrolase extension form [Streptomyces sp. WI04-05B]MDX2585101.1 radical SAM/SPASM protein FxsB, inactivated metallohydrolase extension form [Streptomyces sp. WI04-05A]
MTSPALQQLVLKVHSRCDLACDHCYVYEHADQGWKARPVVISDEALTRTAQQFASYAEAHKLPSVAIILHGGEPLLCGPARLRRICAELTRTLTPVTALDLQIHTNGIQLGPRHLDVFAEFGVKVGISLDGDRAANDRHRLDRRGLSSYDRVLRGIDLLRTPAYRHLFGGLLCTVDVANDPVTVHETLTALNPPRIDYLLPHSTWDNPPPNPSGSPTPYADWLLAVFDLWEKQGRRIPVRTFESVLSTLRGGPSLTEAMGLAPSDLAVVETDGSFEQADSLKTAFDGAAATGFDVFRHGFEEFARHEGVLARQRGLAGVSEDCRRCPVVDSCGGGLYAHRYSAEREFDNPSVFCADLRALVDGIAERVTNRALAPSVGRPDELVLSQLQLDRALLRVVHDDPQPEPGWDDAWRTLLELDAGDDTVRHLNEVLTHPYVRTWLLRSRHEAADLPRFMALAFSAAVRAGADVMLGWDQSERALHLPALGTFTLAEPGRVEVKTAPGGFWVFGASDPVQVQLADAAAAVQWRPLDTVELPGRPALVVDDADSYRDCFPAPLAPGPTPASFAERLRQAYELLDARLPRWSEDRNALLVTTVTPLAPGSGLRLGTHGPGALGAAVDFTPEEFARELPRLGRQARLTSLRETSDLNVLGNRAGRLLDEASEQLGNSRREDAVRALVELTALPERELTETGAVLAAQLWTEWAEHPGPPTRRTHRA